MSSFLTRNSLYLVSAMAVFVGAHTAVSWASLPVMQRMVGLFFVGIVAHVWEENRFPGGFAEMIASKLDFTSKASTSVRRSPCRMWCALRGCHCFSRASHFCCWRRCCSAYWNPSCTRR